MSSLKSMMRVPPLAAAVRAWAVDGPARSEKLQTNAAASAAESMGRQRLLDETICVLLTGRGERIDRDSANEDLDRLSSCWVCVLLL